MWDFATRMVIDEYRYMIGSNIIPIYATTKNMESTPAFPKFLKYKTELEYIEENGWNEYVDFWENFDDKKHVLWWTFLKNEVLKKKKIEDNDIRMIMCTDPVFTRFGAAFEQDQNDRMKQHTETHQAQVGWSPFYGGLDLRLKRLEKNTNFLEIDWTRFDGTIPVQVFRRIKEIRYFFLSDEYKTPENKRRYEWYVNNLIHKLTLLPTGEVTYIKKGNPSGQISTTTDNNMVNTFLTAFEVAYMYKKKNGRVPTIEEYRANVDSICYGDDRLLSLSDDFFYDGLELPQMYKNIFGMWVKPENVKASKQIAGLSFCGFTMIKQNGTYYGVPNVDKILSTFEHPVRRLPDITSLWGKLISLRILCEYADRKVKDYLNLQIHKVRTLCEKEGMQLPEVDPAFYRLIWSGGPKADNGWSEAPAAAESEKI
nr:MAG: RNA-dependent RNA polymerase [Avian astrovirus 12]